ncbi:MAG: Na/Pi cotransporter family protein [Candidatus Thorarchaeota archaeon]|nr:Na/Pi cotransporter family protein [Candidatus Thorarchaeota archaeon]
MQTAEMVFGIVGGLALFMFGITMLRETLGKISGARVTKTLERVSNNPLKGMWAGAAATVMTQSSSITVLTLIGFVNAGIMSFRQSVNVMLGSEIGTTITAQLVAFEIGMMYWPLIAIGFFAGMITKNERVRLVGRILFSLGIIFLAMDFIKVSARPLGENQVFVDMINDYGSNIIIGILIGALIAGLTQSSSATTSLVIALGMSGVIRLDAGIALVMGANIGTCFLELFAAIGATSPAKRTALAQTMINVVGVGMFLPFIGPFTNLVVLSAADLPRQIANAHTIFNVIVSFIMVPLVVPLVRFCERVIPDKEGEIIGKHYFDEQMLNMPQVALREAEREIHRTAETTLSMIKLSREGLLTGDLDRAAEALALEKDVDERCRSTEEFIDKIREEELGERDMAWRMKLLAILTDIERVGDLSENIAEYAMERVKDEISFSRSGNRELGRMFDLVEETYSTAIRALETKNKKLAKAAIALEDQVDVLERELKEAHNERMKEGVCMPEADTLFVETIRNLERIGDHADNIAADIISRANSRAR